MIVYYIVRLWVDGTVERKIVETQKMEQQEWDVVNALWSKWPENGKVRKICFVAMTEEEEPHICKAEDRKGARCQKRITRSTTLAELVTNARI
jgi:hypothetical protein